MEPELHLSSQNPHMSLRLESEGETAHFQATSPLARGA